MRVGDEAPKITGRAGTTFAVRAPSTFQQEALISPSALCIMRMFRHLAAGIATLTIGSVFGQMTVSTAMNPTRLVEQVLLGGGVTVSNVKFNGVPAPPTPQAGSGSFTAVPGSFPLEAGVILSSGLATSIPQPAFNGSSDFLGSGSDPDLLSIIATLNPFGPSSNDKSVLEFDFIPTGDSLAFRYIFASEEYPTFNCSPNFNDVFGFFLSGPGITGPFTNNAINIALVPGTTLPVSIANIHGPEDWGCPPANAEYYVHNEGGQHVVYNGHTVILTAFANVICGETYHIKLAICDAGDTSLDSAVFLEAGSFASTGNVLPAVSDGMGVAPDGTLIEGCGPFEFVFNRLGDPADELVVDMVVSGTATPGVDYSPAFPAQLIFPPGVTAVSHVLEIPMDPDGPETIVLNITSVVECSGQEVETEFTFHIGSLPAMNVTLPSVNGVCGQPHVLNPVVTGGMGEYTFLWSTNETTPSITVTPGGTTTYSVEVSDVCGVEPVTVDATITLPDYPPMAITVTPETQINCLSTGPIGVTSASGGNGVYSYHWQVNGQTVGNTATVQVPAGPPTWYVVTVTDGCGDSVQDSVLVSTVPLPPIQVEFEPYQVVVCPGDTALLQAADISGGNGVYSLVWTNELGQQVGTGSMMQVPVVGDHTYTLTVSDQCQTVGSAQVQVYLPIYPPFTLQMVPDQTICAGDSVMLHALVNGGSGLYFIDWPTLGHTDPLIQVTPVMETTYPVQITDQCGEQLTGSTTIKVEYVYVDIVVTNQGQDDWYLQASSIPAGRTWHWDMGDGTFSRGKEVYHSYNDLEDHWVTLTLTTPNGCVGVDSVLLEAPAHIYFPNAFSPDGDGINDTFGPVGHSIDEFEMSIFNRFGELVFYTDDIHVRWDGTVNGKEQLTGVYVYKYRAKGHYFPAVEGYGHVTLAAGSQHR